MTTRPLVVDLDGTLIRTDMLHESALHAVRNHFLCVFQILPWLLHGKAALKEKLAFRFDFSPDSLPYNQELLEWLKTERDTGRRLILCTATDRSIAEPIADHIGIFEDVIASDGRLNISGPNKAKVLEERFSESGFDYVGNSNADVPVWEKACRAIVANGSPALEQKARNVAEIEKTFPPKRRGIKVWIRVLRVHQWLKNLLLFVPLIAAHELANENAWSALLYGFVSFSFCASAVYVGPAQKPSATPKESKVLGWENIMSI